jgi:hypothetical protein
MDLKAHPRNLGTTKSFSLERAICFSAKSGTQAGIPNLGNKYCRRSRSAVWPTSMKTLGWQVGHSAASIPEKREPIPD